MIRFLKDVWEIHLLVPALLALQEKAAAMTALIITIITSLGEIIDQLFGNNWVEWKADIEIALAVITPLLVWLVPWLGIGDTSWRRGG